MQWRTLCLMCVLLLLGVWSVSNSGQEHLGRYSAGPSSSSRVAEPDHSADADSGGADRPPEYNPHASVSARELRVALSQQRALAHDGAWGGAWTSLGPAPIAYDRGLPPGVTSVGRVLSLAYSASTHALYAGTPGGGIWKSTDSGQSWHPIGDSFMSPAVNAIAVDPHDPNTVYAGTGEISEFGDSDRGVGVYKSTDGGASWQLYGSSLFIDHDIATLVVDPTDSLRVYAAVVGEWKQNQGMGLSDDGGQTWKLALQGANVSDLIVDRSGDLYAAVKGTGVLYSADHGATWTNASAGLPQTDPFRCVLRMALAPNTAGSDRSSQILYLAIGTWGGVEVYRTTDGGGSWTHIASSHDPASLPTDLFAGSDSHLTIGVDPADATGNTVYLGSVNLFKTSGGLGAQPRWTDLLHPTSNRWLIHADQYALLWVPSATGYSLYVGNDGGVYRTDDGGSTFSALNSGLAITQFRGGAIGPGPDPSFVMGGSQDVGLDVLSGGQWSLAQGGDDYEAAVDPTDQALLYTTEPWGNPYRSTDGGKTWHKSAAGIAPIDWTIDLVWGRPDNAMFRAPLVMDPTNPRTLYLGLSHLWRTTDGMQTWTNISPGISTSGITAVAVARSDPSTIYIGDFWDHRSTDPKDVKTHLWATTDGGQTWRDVGGDACTPTNQSPRWCPPRPVAITSLAVDPTDSRIVYAAEDLVHQSNPGSRGNHLFRSSDGGATWRDISVSLPNAPIMTVAISPTHPNVIVTGGALGGYISYDSGASWHLLGTGLPTALWIYHLVLSSDGSHLFAFTNGRGAWEMSLPTDAPPRATPPPTAPPTLTATPIPTPTSVPWLRIESRGTLRVGRTARLTVVVRDNGSAPVQQATVSLAGRAVGLQHALRKTTNAQGRVVFTGIPLTRGGWLVVRAQKAGYVSTLVRVHVPGSSPAFSSTPTPQPLPTATPTYAPRLPVVRAEPCSEEGTLLSLDPTGVPMTDITFVNLRTAPIDVYWLDYEGARKLYSSVAPGASAVEHTWPVHPWLAADTSGACLGIYHPLSQPAEADIQ